MIMHARVRDVLRHALPRPLASEPQEGRIRKRIELQDRRAIDEALRPFRPPTRRIFP